MIYFLTFDKHTYTVNWFKEHTQFDDIQVVPYGQAPGFPFQPGDTVIFCDIDRCNDIMLNQLKSIHDNVSAMGCQVMNSPYKTHGRYDLLRLLAREDINSFDVYRRADLENGAVPKLPAFLRDELDHFGPDTGLIDDRETLNKAIAENDMEGLLVCEYVDVSVNGQFHKYGAFIMGDTIIPRHFFLSNRWSVKCNDTDMSESVEKEKVYLATNPHEMQIREIARMAHIDFGRIDYAISEKGMQVFEINTNPTVIDPGDLKDGNPRRAITDEFIENFSTALNQILNTSYA